MTGGTWTTNGYTDNRDRVIYIRRGLGPTETRRVLLHEMVHAATPNPEWGDAHGAVW